MPQEEEDKPDEATDEAKDEAKDEAELLEAKTDWCDFLLLQNVASERTAVNPRNSKWVFHPFFVVLVELHAVFRLRLVDDMSWLRARNSSLRMQGGDVVAAADAGSSAFLGPRRRS